jgi:hypothetical protein
VPRAAGRLHRDAIFTVAESAEFSILRGTIFYPGLNEAIGWLS